MGLSDQGQFDCILVLSRDFFRIQFFNFQDKRIIVTEVLHKREENELKEEGIEIGRLEH